MDSKTYLEYLTGIASLMDWISHNEKQGYQFVYDGPRIIFDAQITRRFLIGIPKSKKFGQHPFFACQHAESIFLQLLNISRTVVRHKEPSLHLIISGVAGDQFQFPDIAPFVLSLNFDSYDKLAILAEASMIDCRTFYIDEDDQSLHIPNKDILWSKPLIVLPDNAQLLDSQELKGGPSFHDMLKMKDSASKLLKTKR